jgi:hypothetical protein
MIKFPVIDFDVIEFDIQKFEEFDDEVMYF